MILYLYKLIYPSLKDKVCQKNWVKLAYLFWRRRLLIVVNVLLHFCYYPIWCTCGQLNPPLHPRILVPSFVKTVWVVPERFLNIIDVFLNFSYIQYNFAIIFTWKRAFYLGNFEFPSTKNVWLKLIKWFWRSRETCEKVTDAWTDRNLQTTHYRQSEKFTLTLSSGELKWK